ncbi:putative serine/threonine-specific protein kinase pkpA Phycomyces blakesleeanus [Helicostylum pulchrum]|uniref:Protein kinase domain-containing protein n=1 Tax=Helicostylum pulchrum TaxID=562976 RepID=A0ABP9Y5J4_9FUNG|nr:putative serine/threonine-specific protein kinase pkpA Phycomyces blakesleeanus [Helicostylum pulchrum]
MSGSQSVSFEDEIVNFDDEPLDQSQTYYTESDETLYQSMQNNNNFQQHRTNGLSMPQVNEIIDQSRSHDTEKVVEVSPNERYVRLNTLLGKGAYKIVYKAIDREEGYEVAWNTMQATKSIDHKEMEHEIEILKSVRHPNIIAFHDAWYQKNEFVFVTELMTSGTLREYIRKLSLPNIKIVKRWSRQILKGLAYLHGYNPSIIHRDIKCDNIFINGAHGEVKIGDMGTAEMKMGKKYTIIGTPEFMAPEMYEEQGYNEKVDIYAFGMCLLEMVTGDYPYGECKNAAQIYKKVSAGIKPASLSEVQSQEVLDIIDNCLGNEDERMSAQEILEHTFLAVEPDVVLLAADPAQVHLTLQVVFKGMDKLSVKFDFNVETDTAEQVVREMIEEQVLPERYQHHITKEINRILRDIEKPNNKSNDNDQDDNSKESVWRRENDIRSELEKTKEELDRAAEHVLEVELRCDGYENRARTAEIRYRDAVRILREMKETQQLSPEQLDVLAKNPRFDNDLKIDTSRLLRSEAMRLVDTPVSAVSNGSNGSVKSDPIIKKPDLYDSPSPPSTTTLTREALVSRILEEYADDTDIELFVRDCAIASHRNIDKAHEWANKLKNQDIMTVGDLRDLHDEDWVGIGLTVFALRALKNMLKGKKQASQSSTPATSTPISLNPAARVSPPL